MDLCEGLGHEMTLIIDVDWYERTICKFIDNYGY